MQVLMNALREHVERSKPANAGGLKTDDADGTPDRILRTLYKHDRAAVGGRGGEKIVHASSTIRIPDCPRAYYLMHELRQAGVQFTENPFGSMKLVWAYGRAAEKHVRDTLLSEPDMKADAYGLWKCGCEATHYTGLYLPKAEKCGKCGKRPENYHETLLLDPEYGLSGNPDFAYMDVDALRVVEIKSIKGKDEASTSNAPNFEDLAAPVPDHVNQACHYVEMFNRRGVKVHRRPQVIYVCKKFEPRQWYKSFIPEDGPMMRAEAAVAEQRAATKAFREAMSLGRCPGRCEACVADPNKYEKKCPAWAECFARK